MTKFSGNIRGHVDVLSNANLDSIEKASIILHLAQYELDKKDRMFLELESIDASDEEDIYRTINFYLHTSDYDCSDEAEAREQLIVYSKRVADLLERVGSRVDVNVNASFDEFSIVIFSDD